jgi:mannosyltransferase
MIVFDGIVFSLQRHGGVSSYFRALAARVLEQRSDAQLWAYASGERLPEGPQVLRQSSRLLERYRDPAHVPNDAILHSSYYRVSPDARANVVTVYDFMYERFADSLRRFIHVRQKLAAMKRADAIICISEAARSDLREFYPRIPESKLHVVPLAAGPQFSPIAGSDYDSASPYALFIGKRAGYKNFTSAVRGVAAVPGMKLVCVGGGDLNGGESSLIASALPGRFEFVGHVDDAELNRLYNGAHALVYASRFEGFGLPILEAMAAGCPVITTRAPAMVEVAANAACLLDHPDPDNITSALQQLFDERERAAAVARGYERAAAFSWDATVSKTLAVYSTLG